MRSRMKCWRTKKTGRVIYFFLTNFLFIHNSFFRSRYGGGCHDFTQTSRWRRSWYAIDKTVCCNLKTVINHSNYSVLLMLNSILWKLSTRFESIFRVLCVKYLCSFLLLFSCFSLLLPCNIAEMRRKTIAHLKCYDTAGRELFLQALRLMRGEMTKRYTQVRHCL